MIVTILKKEKYGFEKAAAISDIKVSFYTDEKDDRVLRMVIEEGISHNVLFHFTRFAETQNNIHECVSNEPKNWHLNSKGI